MKTVLKLRNDYSWLVSNNLKLKHVLFQHLRFRERNYFHNRRYKMRLWDGYHNFFREEDGRFLTGILPEILAVLNKFNEPYDTIDDRDLVQWRHQSIDSQYLNQWLPATQVDGTPQLPITLEDYQMDFAQKIIQHQRGIIFAPTSSGKTFIMLSIMKALPPGCPILVLQNRTQLAKQNYEEISNWGFPNVGTLWANAAKPNIITCANIQSIHKIVKLLPKFRALFVDEIHDMMSKKPMAVYRKMTAASVRVAMSATPFKFGEDDPVQKWNVKGFFGPVMKTSATKSGIITTKELQERGRLSKSRCVFYPILEPQIPYDIYMDAVTHGIAESYHFHEIVCRLVKKLKGRTLILVERLSHGDALNNMIPGSLWVQGKDNDESRKHVIHQLKRATGDVVAIATQGIFNTGINVFVHNLINAAGGQAEHQIVQRMGRGLRTADDKEILHYYDFIFRINEYLEKHSDKRVKILGDEGHEVIVKEALDF
jgi:superfamily II DNA or RNA helicase